MKKNHVRLFELLGLAAVLIAARVYSPKKSSKALPCGIIDAKEYTAYRKAEKNSTEETV